MSSRSTKRLLDEALRLPASERLRIAERLLAGDLAPTDAGAESAVGKELERRWAAAVRTGKWGPAWPTASKRRR